MLKKLQSAVLKHLPLTKQLQCRFKTSSAFSSELKRFNESFLCGSSADYIDNLFNQWNKDKKSVPASWDAYFRNFLQGADADQAFQLPPETQVTAVQQGFQPTALSQQNIKSSISDTIKIRLIIDMYRTRGHELAKVDPLEIDLQSRQMGAKYKKERPQLNYQDFGFTEKDLNREFTIRDNFTGGITGKNQPERIKLGALIQTLEKVYCGKIGYQFMHITDSVERNFIRDKIENIEQFTPTNEQLIKTAQRLCKDYVFTEFLVHHFSTSKRFGSEGCDSFISGLEAFCDIAAENKVEQIVIGMPHRGRLNTLHSVVDKPAEQIFAEFQETGKKFKDSIFMFAGDVKYHLGTTHDKTYPNNHSMRITVLPNPSHLECVNPVVYGNVRAIQDFKKDRNKEKVIGILMHGDAAFSGQGIVYESIQFQDLMQYRNGGIIHVVANNQIGFTTVPQQNRTSLYCTDIGETVQAPIFHVNAEEPELVDRVFKIAYEYRQKFKKDVIIDVIGYRKFGHNELDQPKFTQPLMYSKIDKMRPVYISYREKLFKMGVWTKEEEEKLRKDYESKINASYEASRTDNFQVKHWKHKEWEELIPPKLWGKTEDTSIPLQVIKEINSKINIIPKDFNAHPQIQKIYQLRHQAIEKDQGLDFANAESLAFGSLLLENYGVRLSGQDVERGTFSHRHSKLNDQMVNRDKYIPLQQLMTEEQIASRKLIISNSHLSEFGVLGFEYGYSISNPNYLVCWEAQFGDFANGAQVMIDNVLVSGESKWGVSTGLVMLMPHGMDGQGPEHSSGRVERFLQLSDDDYNIFEQNIEDRFKQQMEKSNLQIVIPSTTANYFHSLRRQMRRTYRKPLISFNSKRLLRFKPASSFLNEFSEGSKFNTVYPEVSPNSLLSPEQIAKVILCSGQVYYDIAERRTNLKRNDVAILRLEQLAPFPYDHLKEILSPYKNASFIWAQEEHENQGGNYYVRPRYQRVLRQLRQEGKINNTKITYVGRKTSSSSAAGSAKLHNKELEQLLKEAFQ